MIVKLIYFVKCACNQKLKAQLNHLFFNISLHARNCGSTCIHKLQQKKQGLSLDRTACLILRLKL